MGYVLVYFLKGQLPWQGLRAATKEEKYAKILNTKRSTSIEDLCEGLPKEFTIFFNYVRALRFDERPDYPYIRKIFRNLLVRMDFKNDAIYDWLLIDRDV